MATGPHEDEAALVSWLARVRWLKLNVERTELGRPGDSEGHVTFSATFQEGSSFAVLRERSRFVYEEGRWRYVDGESAVQPLKVGRNDECPCGSGKKAKSCHA
jgi:SEC-C motif-containing protein